MLGRRPLDVNRSRVLGVLGLNRLKLGRGLGVVVVWTDWPLDWFLILVLDVLGLNLDLER